MRIFPANIKKLIFIITIIIISIFNFLYVFDISKCCIFWNDDFEYSNYYRNEKIFDCLLGKSLFIHGGGYIGLFLCKFLSFGLPSLLGVHPADFMSFWHGIIKGIFTVLIILLITNFSTIFFKSKILYVSVLIFISAYIFKEASINGLSVFSCNYNFYRYFFSLLFFSVFLHYIYTHCLSQKKVNIITLAGVVFCGIEAGMSSEICIFSSVIMSVLLIIYNVFICFLKKYYHNESKFKSLKLNFDKFTYIPLIFLFCAAVFFVSTPGFYTVAFIERGLSNIHFHLNEFFEFLYLFFNLYVKDILLNWIILFILIIFSFYFAMKKQEIKKLIIPVFLQISLLIVIFSLFLCGKTYNNQMFYISHNNVIFIYRMISLFPSLILFGYLFKNIYKSVRPKFLRKITIWLFSFLIIISAYLAIIPKINFDCDIEKRKLFYVSEKMLRFYYLNNKIPVIPYEFGSQNNPDGLLNPFELEKDEESSKIYKNNNLTLYYSRIYKYKEAEEIGFQLSSKAFERFYEAGGNFSDKELEYIKFSRLYDEDFILNKY